MSLAQAALLCYPFAAQRRTGAAFLNRTKACWISGTRYDKPLNPTQAKKWAALSGLDAELYLIGFAAGLRPQHFQQGAHFYLLPLLPAAPLRYLEMLLVVPVLLLWLIYRHGVNVIVAQSPFEGAAGALVKNTARLSGRRAALVIESHGNFEVNVFGQRRVALPGLYRAVMHAVARYSLRHADVLRGVSASTSEQLMRWSPGKPVEQFMTWTDADAFRDVKREKPLSQSRDLLYAGVLTPLKNVHIVIEAFAALAADEPDVHLWIAGKPENVEYAAGLREQVRQSGLDGRVTFLGAQSQRELAAYMAQARALLLVSQSEGLPRVVVEAMLSGLTVIASRVGGIPEIVEDGLTGYLVPPGDVTALMAAMRQVYANTELDMMGERAQTFARTLFSTEAYVEGYHRVLEYAMNASPQFPPHAPGSNVKREPHS